MQELKISTAESKSIKQDGEQSKQAIGTIREKRHN